MDEGANFGFEPVEVRFYLVVNNCAQVKALNGRGLILLAAVENALTGLTSIQPDPLMLLSL